MDNHKANDKNIPQVNTGGGAYVGKDINAGRDVAGRDIITNVYNQTSSQHNIDYLNDPIAICDRNVNLKEVALFFDKICYIGGPGSIPDELNITNFPNYHYFTMRPKTPGWPRDTDPPNFTTTIFVEIGDRRNQKKLFESQIENVSEYSHETADIILHSTMIALTYDAKASGFDVVPVFGRNSRLFLSKSDTFKAIEIELMNLQVIDASSLEWEQIIEIKKDKNADRKLKNLKLFIYDNYKDKSSAYIRDNIDKKIDEYEQACKKHGFKLITSSISTLLNSKTLMGEIAFGALGVLLGEPMILNVAIIGGALIETSKIAINITEKLMDHLLFKESHELGYIFGVQEKITKVKPNRK